jgi:hypothetical protein
VLVATYVSLQCNKLAQLLHILLAEVVLAPLSSLIRTRELCRIKSLCTEHSRTTSFLSDAHINATLQPLSAQAFCFPLTRTRLPRRFFVENELLFTLAPSGLLPVSKAILQITQEAIGPFVLFNITHSVSNIFGINYSASMQASLL